MLDRQEDPLPGTQLLHSPTPPFPPSRNLGERGQRKFLSAHSSGAKGMYPPYLVLGGSKGLKAHELGCGETMKYREHRAFSYEAGASSLSCVRRS